MSVSEASLDKIVFGTFDALHDRLKENKSEFPGKDRANEDRIRLSNYVLHDGLVKTAEMRERLAPYSEDALDSFCGKVEIPLVSYDCTEREFRVMMYSTIFGAILAPYEWGVAGGAIGGVAGFVMSNTLFYASKFLENWKIRIFNKACNADLPIDEFNQAIQEYNDLPDDQWEQKVKALYKEYHKE